MADRSNARLNEEIESKIRQWDGTIFGASLKNMYENGTNYEGICEYADIDYKDYEGLRAITSWITTEYGSRITARWSVRSMMM